MWCYYKLFVIKKISHVLYFNLIYVNSFTLYLLASMFFFREQQIKYEILRRDIIGYFLLVPFIINK